MGSRYSGTTKCLKCKHEWAYYYAPTCGIFSDTCSQCGTKYRIDENGIVHKWTKKDDRERKDEEIGRHSNKKEIEKIIKKFKKRKENKNVNR